MSSPLPTPAAALRRGRGRLALATWMGVYPVLTSVAWLLEPLLAGLPLPLQTLITSALMVPIMVCAVMPWMERHLLGSHAGRCLPSEVSDRSAVHEGHRLLRIAQTLDGR